MLKDFEVFERTIVAYFPRSRRKAIVSVMKEIDTALGSYIRGQFIVCVIVGIFAYIGYIVIDMPYATAACKHCQLCLTLCPTWGLSLELLLLWSWHQPYRLKWSNCCHCEHTVPGVGE